MVTSTQRTSPDPGSQPGAASRPGATHPRPGRVAGVTLAVVGVQALLVLLFAWPVARSAPHGVPVVVSGPAQVTAGLSGGLAQARPGGFAVRAVSDPAAARSALTGRDAYAAVLIGQSGAEVLIASAANPTLAQLLGQVLPQALEASQPGLSVSVTDLAPNPPGDPHGAVPSVALIPLVITALVAGVALALLAGSATGVLGGLIAVALAGGLVSGWAMQAVLGGLSGSYLANVAVLGLGVLAVASAAAGLTLLARRAGAAVAVVLVFFVGFPLSGALSAPELLPTPWGAIGQWLPPGALSRGLRDVAFFSGSGSGTSLGVLGVWALAGLALAALRLWRGVDRPAGLLREEVQTHPGPTRQQPDPTRPGGHDPGQHLPE